MNSRILISRTWRKYLSSVSFVSPRQQADFEQCLITNLRKVSDPLLSNLTRVPDIVSQGLISGIEINKQLESININIQLPTAAHFGKDDLEVRCVTEAKAALPWAKDIKVSFSNATPQYLNTTQPGLRISSGVKGKEAIPPALKNVGAIVAVASCKGGVGKSTVATNLAFALSKRGGRVGILDLDVYGPSLPTLLHNVVEKSEENGKPVVRRSREQAGMIRPIECEGGVTAMSFGWVNPKAGVKGAGGNEAAVVRGPIASKVVTQLLLATEWGELDYLVLDLPPGTGDVHLTVAQLVRISGAVVVTTPSSLSHVDVLKGVAMYEQLKVPTLAVVENFAFLELPSGEKLHPFGPPGRHMESLSEALPNCRLEDLNPQLPVSDSVRVCNEEGRPLLTRSEKFTDSEAGSQAFQDVADKVIRRVYEESCAAKEAPSVVYKETRGGFVVRYTEHLVDGDAAREVLLAPEELRFANPYDGSKDKKGCEEECDVTPLSVDVRGNYALHIKWSDGHDHPFFTYDAILAIARQKQK